MCRVLLTLISILVFALARLEVCVPELTLITIIALILGLIVAHLFFKGKEISLFKNDIPVITLASFYLISMLCYYQYVNILTVFKYILCVVFYIVVRAINIKSQDFWWSIWCVGLMEALFILYHYFMINLSHGDMRIVTHFSNPALAGCLLALSIGAIVSFVKLRTLSKREKYFYIFSIIVILYAMVIIDSRASFLSLVFALLMINVNKLCRIVRANKCNIYMLIIATLLGAFLLYYYRPDSVNGRFLIWRIALTYLSENFITGHGVNSFEATYMFNQADFFSKNVGIVNQNVADNVYQAFNLFIKSLYEIGFVGCVLLLLTIIPVVYSIFISDQELRYLGILTLMIFIFSIFGYPEDSVVLLSIWMILYAICISKMNLILQYDCIKIKLRSKIVTVIVILVVIPLLVWNWWQLRRVENVLKKDEIVMVLGDRVIMDMPGILEIWHRLAFDTYNNVNDAEVKSRIISKALSIAPHSDLCVYLGDLCVDGGKYLLAEEYYEMASNMVPALLYPKYKLFRLYEETGQIMKAKKLGMEILSMDIKIVNSLVLKIKNEVRVKIAQISESPK